MPILDEWLKDIPQQFQNKHNITVLFSAFARQMQEIENVFEDLNIKTDLDSALGVNLDNVGSILSLTRKQAAELAHTGTDEYPQIEDERYRQLLKYKRLVNTNECTYYDLMEGMRLLWGEDKPIYYEEREEHPAVIFFATPDRDIETEDPMLLKNLLLKPAGVGIIYSDTYTMSMELIDSFNLDNITVCMYIPMDEKARRLDGTWILDGSVEFEKENTPSFVIKVLHKNAESETKLLDGSWFLDGSFGFFRFNTPSFKIGTKVNTEETVEATVSTKEGCFANGHFLFDGTKQMNATIIKEEL